MSKETILGVIVFQTDKSVSSLFSYQQRSSLRICIVNVFSQWYQGFKSHSLSSSQPCRTGLSGKRPRPRREGERHKRFGQHLVEYSRRATPVVTCGLKCSSEAFGTNVETYSINNGSMTGSSGVVTNADESPVSTVNGATAAIRSACSLSNSGVGFATMPAKPMSLLGCSSI